MLMWHCNIRTLGVSDAPSFVGGHRLNSKCRDLSRPDRSIAGMLRGKVALVTGMLCWPSHTHSIDGNSIPQHLATIAKS